MAKCSCFNSVGERIGDRSVRGRKVCLRRILSGDTAGQKKAEAGRPKSMTAWGTSALQRGSGRCEWCRRDMCAPRRSLFPAFDCDGDDFKMCAHQKFVGASKGARRKAFMEICPIHAVEVLEKTQIGAKYIHLDQIIH